MSDGMKRWNMGMACGVSATSAIWSYSDGRFGIGTFWMGAAIVLLFLADCLIDAKHPDA